MVFSFSIFAVSFVELLQTTKMWEAENPNYGYHSQISHDAAATIDVRPRGRSASISKLSYVVKQNGRRMSRNFMIDTSLIQDNENIAQNIDQYAHSKQPKTVRY